MNPSTMARAAVRPVLTKTPRAPMPANTTTMIRRIGTAARRPAASSSASASSASASFAPFFRRAAAFRAASRRFQSTSAAAPESWAVKFWNSPVGPKTVHFWGPVMKWALVLAGITDLARPAENLSVSQNIALTATGLIWTRWCLIIKPKNILLATVNFFLGIVGVVQCTRIFMYRQSIKNKEAPVAAAEAAVAAK